MILHYIILYYVVLYDSTRRSSTRPWRTWPGAPTRRATKQTNKNNDDDNNTNKQKIQQTNRSCKKHIRQTHYVCMYIYIYIYMYTHNTYQAGNWTLESEEPTLEPPHPTMISYADPHDNTTTTTNNNNMVV